jgi:hypothetical protein
MAATTPRSVPTHVFIVQKSAASLAGYAEAQTITEIAGVFASLVDANALVRQCQKEFMRDFAIEEHEVPGDFIGFKTEDKGDVYDGTPSPTGTQVGYYWEYDEDLVGHFYSCGVKCFPLIAGAKR